MGGRGGDIYNTIEISLIKNKAQKSILVLWQEAYFVSHRTTNTLIANPGDTIL